MSKTLFVVLLLVTPTYALHAQEPRLQLPTARERRVADVISWGTALTPIALDANVSWHCPDRRRCLLLQGARIGTTYSLVWLAKTIVHRQRPCAPDDCGADNPNFSFFSGHTAGAFQAFGGPRASIVITLGVSTGGLRVAAGKHWVTDTLVGAGVGLLTSRIR